MGRPPLPVGTWGDITTHPTRGGRYLARARFRDYDGRTRHVCRTGDTPRKAKAALTAAMAERARTVGDELTADSRLEAVVPMWLDGLVDRTEGTRRTYTDALRRYVLPALGERRLREITTRTVEVTIDAISEKHGPGVARTSRVVLSQLMGTAVRMDAIDRNPVSDARRPRAPKPEPRALTPAEISTLRAALAAYEARGRSKADVSDVVEVSLATGARIGEVLALRWEDVDLEAGTVTICGTVALPAKPPMTPFRQGHPKTSSSIRTLLLPAFGVEVLLRRRVKGAPSDLVFPSARDTVRDPAAVRKTLKRALEGTDLEWVTPHTFRRTVATLVRDPETAAGVLGNGTDMARRHYIERAPMAPDVRDLLGGLAPQSAG
ncbi:site-specific integrase [Actinomyces bowdenii]|uniref:tyrosine-type recombinase/integrase n=1 Tax=Actinomyces bowdenii TaxID=131109 RepID=UPI00214B6BC7|nr:site-specific integrase [Actinomyces bowdenii]MCR2051771.1 site-specific integrase [Actinomyces bowdenii]